MQSPNMSKRLTKVKAPTIDSYQTVERYEAAHLGAPFKVILHNAVKQYIDADTGKILRTQIPNLSGLRKEVALSRCLHPRKLNGLELKFVRKAIGLKAIELSSLLDITPEHLSRCEGGDRLLSGAAEKLLRVIVLKKTHILADFVSEILDELEEREVQVDNIEKIQSALTTYRDCIADLESKVLKMDIEPAFDPNEILEFSFRIKELKKKPATPPQEDDTKWQMAEAA